MLGSLNSGVSGLRQFQNEMDVIGNNIANADTRRLRLAGTAGSAISAVTAAVTLAPVPYSIQHMSLPLFFFFHSP